MDKEKTSFGSKLLFEVKNLKLNFRRWINKIFEAYVAAYDIICRQETFIAKVRKVIYYLIVIPVMALKHLPVYLGHRPDPQEDKKEKLPFEYTVLADAYGLTHEEAMSLHKRAGLPKTLLAPASPINNPNIKLLSENSGIYRRNGHWVRQSSCGFRIEKNEENKKAKVILSQLPGAEGTSLTNMYELFATDIFWLFLHDIPQENIEWYDYWPKEAYKSKLPSFEPILERVFLEWDKKQFSNPKWRRLEIPQGWEEKNKITVMQ